MKFAHVTRGPERGRPIRAEGPHRMGRESSSTLRKGLTLGFIGVAAIVPFLIAGCTSEIRPSSGAVSVHLDARSDWLGTGLYVKKGDKVAITCRGTWAVAPENERARWPDAGPEGHGAHPGERVHAKGDPKKELPGIPFGTLLGKVSDRVFPIGNLREIVSPAEGELFLVINDYPFYRHDNRGGLTIELRVE